MQSKISAFFRSPSSSSSFSPAPKSPVPPPIIDAENDDLAIWENKDHQFFNTYSRRAPNLYRSDEEPSSQLLKKPNSDNCFSKPESTISGKTVIKNKKRSYAQFHLELGQSDFLLHTCSTCGIKYAPGDKEDEKAHKTFHKDYTHGIQFKGWIYERVIHMHTNEGGRIIAVFDSDPPAWRNKVREVVKMMEIELESGWIFHKLCKVFLFISSQRVVGCVVAEPIKKAFRVFSTSVGGTSDGANKKEERRRPTVLHFGDISFQREVVKRATSASNTLLLDEKNGAIFCEKEAVPAVCGIRSIWVSPANRRKHIATQLLDAVRKSFCLGYVLERSQLAFSQPTSAGKALASNYVGVGSFLVYKSNNVDSDC
ncbi:protein CHROMOSOME TRANSMISSION FIDELITY 7 [Ziziphus jujuba]|uniref:protein Chromosome transmission fidelity 7-like n=2 Tax=Ziziphus jujuba TaxID=326968 RepID=A0A6P4BI87_ZIZJJ|nr:protein CHROMOSOME TRANSMISSION FIDELITY 7 [Ziziphus jujuba]KAH7512247.1 hypothetical protein FEM48_Zijuj12G0070100 [Ziziphus jujuba var. spinosa]